MKRLSQFDQPGQGTSVPTDRFVVLMQAREDVGGDSLRGAGVAC